MHCVILRDDDTNALTPVEYLEQLYRPFLGPPSARPLDDANHIAKVFFCPTSQRFVPPLQGNDGRTHLLWALLASVFDEH